MILGIMAPPVRADLEFLDPEVAAQQRELAEKLNVQRDVDGLLKLLDSAHLFIKTDVALKLGRLGAKQALPALKKLDADFVNFACSESGQFRVAIILIENKTPKDQKNALLKVATEPFTKQTHESCVIDAAGQELGRYEGDDIVKALAPVNTYGAQSTVFKLQCKKLSEADSIAKCIEAVEVHETPMKAQAAEEVLIGIGDRAKPAVDKLKSRAEARNAVAQDKREISLTIINRCDHILRMIDINAKAKPSQTESGK